MLISCSKTTSPQAENARTKANKIPEKKEDGNFLVILKK
jgi:hypothetical protein